ncbi:hypothetical protein [Secundilactobacillus kimchicus]|uniref:hypothetical protein n=1 Tax=Secundilactobacillus kimchicus TaxID=528209 RepID=UPI000704EFA9|nr:hypothetical protein [Secundilactobacillus kimchicus]
MPSKINSLFLYLAFHPISGSLIFLIVNAFIADNVDPSIWSFLFSTFILSFFSATSVYSQHPDKESYLVKVKSTYLWTNIIGSVLTLAAFLVPYVTDHQEVLKKLLKATDELSSVDSYQFPLALVIVFLFLFLPQYLTLCLSFNFSCGFFIGKIRLRNLHAERNLNSH